MNRRQEQKLKTKLHIIDTAMQQFAKDGLTLARTSDIAQAAGVSHGTVFSHFPTREILLEEVIEEFGNRIAARLHNLVEENHGIREILEAHIKGIEEYEDFYIRLISEAPLLNESVRNTLIMIQSTISVHLIDAAEREMESGNIMRMPLNLMFNTWMGLINYYMLNKSLFAPGSSVAKVHGEMLINHYMNIISVKKEVK